MARERSVRFRSCDSCGVDGIVLNQPSLDLAARQFISASLVPCSGGIRRVPLPVNDGNEPARSIRETIEALVCRSIHPIDARVIGSELDRRKREERCGDHQEQCECGKEFHDRSEPLLVHRPPSHAPHSPFQRIWVAMLVAPAKRLDGRGWPANTDCFKGRRRGLQPWRAFRIGVCSSSRCFWRQSLFQQPPWSKHRPKPISAWTESFHQRQIRMSRDGTPCRSVSRSRTQQEVASHPGRSHGTSVRNRPFLSGCVRLSGRIDR